MKVKDLFFTRKYTLIIQTLYQGNRFFFTVCDDGQGNSNNEKSMRRKRYNSERKKKKKKREKMPVINCCISFSSFIFFPRLFERGETFELHLKINFQNFAKS